MSKNAEKDISTEVMIGIFSIVLLVFVGIPTFLYAAGVNTNIIQLIVFAGIGMAIAMYYQLSLIKKKFKSDASEDNTEMESDVKYTLSSSEIKPPEMDTERVVNDIDIDVNDLSKDTEEETEDKK